MAQGSNKGVGPILHLRNFVWKFVLVQAVVVDQQVHSPSGAKGELPTAVEERGAYALSTVGHVSWVGCGKNSWVRVWIGSGCSAWSLPLTVSLSDPSGAALSHATLVTTTPWAWRAAAASPGWLMLACFSALRTAPESSSSECLPYLFLRAVRVAKRLAALSWWSM